MELSKQNWQKEIESGEMIIQKVGLGEVREVNQCCLVMGFIVRVKVSEEYTGISSLGP